LEGTAQEKVKNSVAITQAKMKIWETFISTESKWIKWTKFGGVSGEGVGD
jgi:hypothetical protein